MWSNQPEFLNGIIRKFKPPKVLEVGINRGGSSIITNIFQIYSKIGLFLKEILQQNIWKK